MEIQLGDLFRRKEQLEAKIDWYTKQLGAINKIIETNFTIEITADDVLDVLMENYEGKSRMIKVSTSEPECK